MGKEELDKMVNEMKSQEEKNGKGDSGRLMDRIPSLNRFAAKNNAIQGGQK